MAEQGESPEFDAAALHEQLASFDVDQFILSAASTIATLAYAKLDRNDLPQARKAIDALAALTPLVDGELAVELRGALATLQLAYAEAASGTV